VATTRPEAESICAICGCSVHRTANTYGRPTIEGRSHATRHHYVAERFYGRSANRRGELRTAVFGICPWGIEGEAAVFCYDCHEELLHNPVLLQDDIEGFAQLVRAQGLNEERKTDDRGKLAGRIQLLHEVIRTGIQTLPKEQRSSETTDRASEDTP
jgi:hypothetical protein